MPQSDQSSRFAQCLVVDPAPQGRPRGDDGRRELSCPPAIFALLSSPSHFTTTASLTKESSHTILRCTVQCQSFVACVTTTYCKYSPLYHFSHLSLDTTTSLSPLFLFKLRSKMTFSSSIYPVGCLARPQRRRRRCHRRILTTR